MANVRALREYDAWDQGSRIRYGSKGRLTSTRILGEPGTPIVFDPITLSPKRNARTGALLRRTVGGAEIASLRRGASEPDLSRTPSTASSSSGPRHVSLGHTVRSGEPQCGPDSPHFPKALSWYDGPDSDGGAGSGPVSMSASFHNDKSPQFEVARPPKTQIQLDAALSKKRIQAGGVPFTSNSTSRASYVSHPGLADTAKGRFPQRRPARQPLAHGPKRERHDMTSSGGLQGWTAEEMANARGIATFTAEHTTVEHCPDQRPAAVGRNLHYFLEE